MMIEISCKYCSFTFKDKTVLYDHMINEHKESCDVCHKKFEHNKRLKEHKHISNIEYSAAIENILNCAYCEFTCSDEGILKKHTKSDHKIDCRKCFTTFRNQEARYTHMWEDHPTPC